MQRWGGKGNICCTNSLLSALFSFTAVQAWYKTQLFWLCSILRLVWTVLKIDWRQAGIGPFPSSLVPWCLVLCGTFSTKKAQRRLNSKNKSLPCSTKSYCPNQNHLNVLKVLSVGSLWEGNVGLVADLFSLNFCISIRVCSNSCQLIWLKPTSPRVWFKSTWLPHSKLKSMLAIC